MLPRIPLASVGSPSLDLLLDRIRRSGRSIEPHHLFLGNHPPALQAFVAMSEFIRSQTALTPRRREMVTLATAASLGSPYIWDSHVTLGAAAGVSPSELDWLRGRDKCPRTVDPLEQAMVAFAHGVARERDSPDEVFEQLQSNLPDAVLVELVLTIAWYHLCAALVGPIHLSFTPPGPSEPYLEPDRRSPR